jgi:hypothetical protein
MKININSLNENNLKYSKNMWLEINTINKNNIIERDRIKSFLYLISQKNNFDIEYMENLQKIYILKNKICSFDENDNTLNNLYKVFFEEMLIEIELLKKNSEIILNDIIKPLSKLINDTKLTIKKLNDNLLCLRNEYKLELKNVEDYKNKYYFDVKKYENNLIKYEKLKSENNEDNFLLKNKEEQEHLFENIKKSEEQYIKIVENANIIRKKYINCSIEIYNQYQNNDENYYMKLKIFLSN